MTQSAKYFLLWVPRCFCILYALFLGAFAFDVFQEDLPPGRMIVALLIHLIPAFLVLLVLAVSWGREWVGAVLFLSLATYYWLSTAGRVHWSAVLLISGNAYLLGGMFLVDWILRKKLHIETRPPGITGA